MVIYNLKLVLKLYTYVFKLYIGYTMLSAKS